MTFKSLGACIRFLEKEGDLVRITREMDPDLEMAQVHNRVYEAGGPAILFEKVKGSRFPALSNLFGTRKRALKILEPELDRIKTLIALKSEGLSVLRLPGKMLKAAPALLHALPRKRVSGPVLEKQCRIGDLPQIRCWPKDGGGFILLPQVFTREPGQGSVLASNIGMYRIQMSGGEYQPDREVGLHYQIHRGIGVHHAKALEQKEALRVSIFVGGPPAHCLAAVMPLPEGMPEIAFAGALAGRRFRYTEKRGAVISLDADFCITGRVLPGKTKKEGPFGDHLGYYSLEHEFPLMEVESVYHKKGAVWPFTVVGRPPREDSIFGELIHEMTKPAVSDTLPGVTAVHAVDAAGVHPLLLVKARERYLPYGDRRPMELLTHANAILGAGQLSLAKYLLICAHEDQPGLDITNEMEFFTHLLERIDFSRDLHFQTCTTMDTLDYSSPGLNRGSKLIMAASGKKLRTLSTRLPQDLSLPDRFDTPGIAGPGMLVIQGPEFEDYESAEGEITRLCEAVKHQPGFKGFPLICVVDDATDSASTFANFLWIAFSRSNPSHDIYGVGSFNRFKHWGCRGSLVMDSRQKPFHAKPLEPDKDVVKRVEALAKKGGDLYGII